MKRMSLLLFLLIFGLVSAQFAQTNLNAPIPVDPNVKIGKLKNGFTYYIRKNSKPENKVEFRLAVNAGAILERADQNGYAHFLEHMAFNGTKNFKKNELVSYLQSIGVDFGADLNAYTNWDETVYQLSIPTEKKELLDKGLLVMQDWASSITLDPEEVKKEQGVVLEELRLGRGAEARMEDRYNKKLFYGSKYAEHNVIGKKELLENVNYKALVDFYQDWYRPDLMSLVVVGDIDPNDVEAKIKAGFSGIKAKRKAKPRPVFPMPDHKETFVAVETDKEATFTSARLVFKKPAEQPKTLADLRKQLVRQFFNGMLNARLDEIRQSPNPPFIGGSASFSGFVRTKNSYTLFASTSPEGIKQSINTLLLENRRVQEFGFTPAEFERQKNRYLTNLENQYKERDKRESWRLIDAYVYHFLEGDPVPGIEFHYKFGKEVVPTITLDEVNALGKDTITDGNRVIIVTGLLKDGVKYPTESEILSMVKESQVAKLEPYKESVVTEPLVSNLPVTAKVVEEKKDEKFGLTYWTLSNGIKVILKPTDFKADEILMRGYSPGGASLLSDEKFKSTVLLGQLVNESGLKNMSKVELGKYMAGKRAAVSTNVSELFESVAGSSTPKDFETMLQMTYLKFTAVNFDKAVFDSFITKQKMFLPTITANPQFYFTQETFKIKNQGNPRFISPFDTATYDIASFEDMKAVYKDRFSDASDFTFIFIGNFENESIKPQILRYLGNLPATNRKESWKDLGIKQLDDKLDKTIEKGIEDKSLVQISFGGETAYNEAEDRNLSALGELLTIKLIEILREEKGGVYGAGAFGGMSQLPRGRYVFQISFPCGSANVESLTSAALEELRKLRDGQIEEKDIAKVKETQLVRIKESVKQNNYWSGVIANFVTRGDKIKSIDEIEAEINSLNKADMQKVAQKYLSLDRMQRFVLMPEDKK